MVHAAAAAAVVGFAAAAAAFAAAIRTPEEWFWVWLPLFWGDLGGEVRC